MREDDCEKRMEDGEMIVEDDDRKMEEDDKRRMEEGRRRVGMVVNERKREEGNEECSYELIFLGVFFFF